MDNIDTRLRAVIEDTTGEARRFKELQDQTGIDANRWKAVWHGRQRVMPDMIEAIAKLHPQYAFWLATGILDVPYGHTAPADQGYPQKGQEQTTSTQYFQNAIAEKSNAHAAIQAWLSNEEIYELLSSKPKDDWLRVAHQLMPTDTGLDAQRRKTAIAAKLRAAEIAMHNEMPTLDYDETDAVLTSIERHLNEKFMAKASTEFPEQTATVAKQIEQLRAKIKQHQKRSATENDATPDKPRTKRLTRA
ncbi:hypothetical protein [Burkholderia vietnamiensis]|uniref:hypothetical protein n=1 Tax=Burkholderia vietnamiensis TaxID=60552 RepID=UPI000AC0EA68|nr:hypothetical protein [Burkholderia vietnamiensis]